MREQDDEIGLDGDGPVSEQVAEVGEGVEVVAGGAGDQGQDRGGGVSALFAADEQPVFTADRQATQRAFGGVVVDGELAVVGVTAQRVPLLQGIANLGRDRVVGQDLRGLLVEPGAELGQDRPGVLLTDHRDLRGAFGKRQVAPVTGDTFLEATFDLVELPDAGQRDVGTLRVAVAALEELASGVRRRP